MGVSERGSQKLHNIYTQTHQMSKYTYCNIQYTSAQNHSNGEHSSLKSSDIIQRYTIRNSHCTGSSSCIAVLRAEEKLIGTADELVVHTWYILDVDAEANRFGGTWSVIQLASQTCGDGGNSDGWAHCELYTHQQTWSLIIIITSKALTSC